MPDIWMDVDVALSEVPINKMPLIDDTDFKAKEESVTFNQAGLDLLWNFLTTAGVFTQTVVTPTDTVGVYDWVNQGNGFYTIEIPASAGGTINNDAEGFGWFSGYATGILPWIGPIVGFRAAALNNALVDGGDNLQVDVTHIMNAILTEGAGGRLAASFIKLLDVATPLLVASDVMRGTDNANTTTPPTVSQIQTELEENGASLLDIIRDELANATDGLSALKTLLDAIPTTAMRGTDNASTHDAAAVKTAIEAGGSSLAQILTDTGTTLENHLTDVKGATFSGATDSLEEIRNRGDAAWAGAPESVRGTIAVQTADTVFNLTATLGTLSTVDDTYNNMIVCILDNSGSVYETARITDYIGASTRITIDHELTFPVQNGVDTFVIYRAAYAPVGAASITENDKNDIVDKVHDEDLLAAHKTSGTAGSFLRKSGGRY